MAKQVAPATIHTVDALLKKLPKKDPQRPVSMSKAIAQLMPAIKTAIDLGHSPADIAAVFAKGGIEIGEPTLKAYMRQGSARTNASPPNDRAATATEVGSVENESAPSSMET